MFLEILGIILLVLAVLITLFFIIFSDAKLIFWFLTSKNKFRYRMLKKYNKHNKDIMCLGTVHDMHFNFDEYGFHHLKAVLLNYKPDVLLVESRQSELDLENLADGPIEMFYLSMIARDMDIPVIGVDWYDPKVNKPGNTNKIRDEHIFSNIGIAFKQYKKPLLVIGATHLLLEKKLFKQHEYELVDISKEEQDALFEYKDATLKFHKDSVKYINRRIKREKEFLNSGIKDEKWIKSSKYMIDNLERFNERILKGIIILED